MPYLHRQTYTNVFLLGSISLPYSSPFSSFTFNQFSPPHHHQQSSPPLNENDMPPEPGLHNPVLHPLPTCRSRAHLQPIRHLLKFRIQATPHLPPQTAPLPRLVFAVRARHGIKSRARFRQRNQAREVDGVFLVEDVPDVEGGGGFELCSRGA